MKRSTQCVPFYRRFNFRGALSSLSLVPVFIEGTVKVLLYLSMPRQVIYHLLCLPTTRQTSGCSLASSTDSHQFQRSWKVEVKGRSQKIWKGQYSCCRNSSRVNFVNLAPKDLILGRTSWTVLTLVRKSASRQSKEVPVLQFCLLYPPLNCKEKLKTHSPFFSELVPLQPESIFNGRSMR